MEEWFRDWFSSEEYLDVYQHRDDDDARKLLDLIFRNTNLSSNPFILDAACGAGRHLLNLTAAGYVCTGFDLSMTLLKIAKKESASKGISLNVFCADIRKVCLKSKFDLVMNLFTSFGYFNSDEENFKFCTTAFNILKPGGIYVLDYLNADYLMQNILPESVKVMEDKTITEIRRIENGRVDKEIIIKSKNGERKFLESVRLYSKERLIKELQKIGFELDSVFGDYDGTEFNKDASPRLILFLKR